MNISIVILSAFFTFNDLTRATEFLTTITPYTSDIFSLGPPVYTLIVPGPMRTQITRMARSALGLPKMNRVHVSSVATAP
ncbi:hypothetical protein PMAYCL1PPCAC_08866, partial [Pristionchus mayeri]